jgi:hypothetical protein
MANRVLARLVNRRLGTTLTDLGPMRAADRVALVKLQLRDRRSGWPLEMVMQAHHAHWNIEEVPVPYRPRVGVSKVTGTVRGVWNATRDMRRQLAGS